MLPISAYPCMFPNEIAGPIHVDLNASIQTYCRRQSHQTFLCFENKTEANNLTQHIIAVAIFGRIKLINTMTNDLNHPLLGPRSKLIHKSLFNTNGFKMVYE